MNTGIFNTGVFSSWQLWAVLSAVFAALTAVFAKVGVENVNSDLATFIRTIVVVCILALIVYATHQLQNPAEISGRTYLFLVLSGLGTGGRTAQRDELAWHPACCRRRYPGGALAAAANAFFSARKSRQANRFCNGLRSKKAGWNVAKARISRRPVS
jgi:hypothetical protein